jgi:hypothetical protein
VVLIRFASAAAIYTVFAAYLYQPHFEYLDPLLHALVLNSALASLGCFLLSRRWVSGFLESLFAGAVYGFGPFFLGLAKFHPIAGLLAACIPWLFCPAAFWRKARWRWTSFPLLVLPFLAILLFFQISVHYRLFAIPLQVRFQAADLASLIFPLVTTKRGLTSLGLYHVPIAPLAMGLLMLVTARRFGIVAVFVIGMALAFCNSLLDISPIIWLALPALCCSVVVGAGMQGLVSAGPADRKWVLTVAIIMGVLAIATLVLATKYFQVFAGLGTGYAKLLVRTANMYILGAVTVAIIFFVARAKLRLCQLRQFIICSAIAADMFFGATFVVDKIL